MNDAARARIWAHIQAELDRQRAITQAAKDAAHRESEQAMDDHKAKKRQSPSK